MERPGGSELLYKNTKSNMGGIYMKKKTVGTFILVCGILVVGLEIVLTAANLVEGKGLGDDIFSVLSTLAIGAFLLVFGLMLRKEGK